MDGLGAVAAFGTEGPVAFRNFAPPGSNVCVERERVVVKLVCLDAAVEHDDVRTFSCLNGGADELVVVVAVWLRDVVDPDVGIVLFDEGINLFHCGF